MMLSLLTDTRLTSPMRVQTRGAQLGKFGIIRHSETQYCTTNTDCTPLNSVYWTAIFQPIYAMPVSYNAEAFLDSVTRLVL